MSDAAFWLASNRLDDSSVEAFDEAVGLRPIRSGQAMDDVTSNADSIEWMSAGGMIAGFVLHVDSKAIGELASIIGKDGVNPMWEVGEKAIEKSRCGVGIAFGMDLHVDIAGGPIDGDEGVALAPLQGGQVLEIDMNEADGRLLEDANPRLVWFGSPIETVANQTAVDSAARELGIETAAHHLDNVVEGQLQSSSQFTDECFLDRRQADCQGLGRVRSVFNGGAAAPTADRGLADAQLGRQLGGRGFAALNVSPDFRCRRGIGVQVQLHDPRRSLTYEMPRSTLIPSNQSPGTEHFRGGDRS